MKSKKKKKAFQQYKKDRYYNLPPTGMAIINWVAFLFQKNNIRYKRISIFISLNLSSCIIYVMFFFSFIRVEM